LGVPHDWTSAQLLSVLQEVDTSLGALRYQQNRLFLYPSCFGTIGASSTQTALLDLGENLDYFESLDKENPNVVTLASGHMLSIDCTFYGLTPLNIPDGDIAAELVFPS
jgi:hypothetical protein